MRAWQGFRRMNGISRGVALQATIALAATWVALRAIGFRRWKAVLVRLMPRPLPAAAPMDPSQTETAREIARILEATSRHLTFHSSCLEQSLALWWLLGWRGIPADLRIGARKEAGRFEAHAWVESGSTALSDAGDEHTHFTPFDGSIISMETQPH
jgi:Transglutaminase-like superfamily